MQLSALEIGIAFKKKLFTEQVLLATVRDIFAKVINLELESGDLVAITTGELFNAPNNLRLSLVGGLDWRELDIKVGDEVELSLREFYFKRGGIRIDLRQVEAWNGDLNNRFLTTDSHNFRENLSFFKKLIINEGHLAGLGELAYFSEQIVAGQLLDYDFNSISELAYTIVFSLIRALLLKNEELFLKNSERLLGLGPGLTPAGDDFLLGLYTMLEILAPRTQLNYLNPENKKTLLLKGRAKTTLLSQTMLEYVLQGQVAQPILELVESLFADDEAELFCNTLRLLDLGSTSGSDIATGLLLGGEVLISEDMVFMGFTAGLVL